MSQIFVLKYSTVALIIMLLVIAVGYMLGRIDIKGVRLGSSGVFISAVIAGCIIGALCDITSKNDTTTLIGSVNNIATVSQNIGLILFITAIGYTAGPTFVKTIKNGAVSFIILSAIVVTAGLGTTLLIWVCDKNLGLADAFGLMMGALTSTPGLSSAKDAFPELKDMVQTMNAIAYPFGVLGACLFVQIVPKFFNKNLEEAKQKLDNTEKDESKTISNVKNEEKLIEFDKTGLAMYCLAGIFGIILGSITIPGINFNLTTTGGCLISGLIFGLVGKVGKLSLKVPKNTLSVLKETGLVFFLYGSGISGGFGFLPEISQHPIYFVYGMIITLVPMVIGFIVALRCFKMDILTNLGAITGAMTSTPALGALEQVAQTDNVSSCYTATYPLALFLLVIIPQIVKLFI